MKSTASQQRRMGAILLIMALVVGFAQPKFARAATNYLAVGWSAPQSYYTRAVAWGDVNGDGYPDLAVGNSGQPDQLYLNNNGVLSHVVYNTWTKSG